MSRKRPPAAVTGTIEVLARWRTPDGRVRRKVILARALGPDPVDGLYTYTLRAPAPRSRVLSLKAKQPKGTKVLTEWPNA